MLIAHTTSWYEPKDAETARRFRVARSTWELVYRLPDYRIVPGHQRENAAVRTSKDLGDPRSLPFIKDLIAFGFSAPGGVDAVMLTNADTCIIPSAVPEIIEALNRWGCYFSLRYEHRRFNRPLPDEVARRAPIFGGADLFALTRHWWSGNNEEYPDMLLGAEAWDGVLKALILLRGFTAGRPCAYHEAHRAHWVENMLTDPSQRHKRALAEDWIRRNGVSNFLCDPGDLPVATRPVPPHSAIPGANRPPIQRSNGNRVAQLMSAGVSLDHSGNLAQAEEAFRAVLRLMPSFTLAWTNLASVLLRRGQS